jgi:hypothetical protein
MSSKDPASIPADNMILKNIQADKKVVNINIYKEYIYETTTKTRCRYFAAIRQSLWLGYAHR